MKFPSISNFFPGVVAHLQKAAPLAASTSNVFSDMFLSMLGTGTGTGWSQGSFNSYYSQGYAKNPYVYRAVRHVSTAVANVPWKILMPDGSIVKDHDVLSLLDRPNPTDAGSKFTRKLVTDLLLSGDAFIFMALPETRIAPPQEIYRLKPSSVRIQPGKRLGEVAYFEYSSGSKERFSPASVIHFQEFSPVDEYCGLSPLAAGWESTQLSNEARQFNMSLLKNGARLSGILTAKTPLTREQKEQLKASVAGFSGTKHAGGTPVLDADLQWNQTGASPAEMSFESLQNMSARESAIVFGVPPQVLGLPESATFANFEQAQELFCRYTLLPTIDFVADELNAKLMPLYGDGAKLIPDLDAIPELQSDRKAQADAESAKADRQAKLFAGGIISRNEARTALGMEPDTDPSSDEFLTPTQPTTKTIKD